jgi:hypothetical protein
MNHSIIINIIYFIAIIYSIFIKPYFQNSFNGTYLQNLKIYYSSINSLKLTILLPLLLSFGILITIIYNISIKKQNSRYKHILLYIFYIILILFTSEFLPKHCSLGLCSYTKPKNVNLSKNNYINFFALGDIQNHHNKDTIYKNRVKKTKQYIDTINDLIKKFKNKDFSNMNMIKLENTPYKDIFINAVKDDVLGVISVGDCTQFGVNTGNLFEIHNDIGSYEYAFNNNEQDGGLLDIPSFECLGNHDYDVTESTKGKIIYRGENPSLQMQLRRNKYRKYVVNKDKSGNYSCDFGKLHLIFINVWPSEEELLNGKPTNSLNFLENDLKQHGHKEWMIVTHFIPMLKSFDDNYIDVKHGVNNKAMAKFGKIYNKYRKTCLGGLYGHVHTKLGYYGKAHDSTNGFIHHLLPGPAAYADDPKFIMYDDMIKIPKNGLELPFFVFEQKTNQKYSFRIHSYIKNNKFHYVIYGIRDADKLDKLDLLDKLDKKK